MELLEEIPLAPLTTLGVGGAARFLVESRSDAELTRALEWAAQHRVGVRVLGGGSNVVVSDSGYPGLVLRLASRGVELTDRGDHVELTAAAGEPWDALVQLACDRGLTGLECLSGIPGQAGATPVQNVGAYGVDVARRIVAVRAVERTTLEPVELGATDCGFRYRDSRFKSGEPERFVITGVTYRLDKGDAPAPAYAELARHLGARGLARPTASEIRESVLAVRRSKSMVLEATDENRRSCGSFFLNPVVDAELADEIARRAGNEPMPRYPERDGRVKLAAAWLIERAGLSKGERLGPVGLSTRHSLALVAHDGARASDVVAFARRVRARVAERFGVRLIPEPAFWGFASLDDGLPDERT